MKLLCYPFLLLTLFCTVGCGSQDANEQSATSLTLGRWRFALDLAPERELPFIATLDTADSGYQLFIHNAAERLSVDTVSVEGDSVIIRMAVFDSEFRGIITTEGGLEGQYHDYSRPGDYQIPFRASPSQAPLFDGEALTAEVADRYAVTFSPNTSDAYVAVGAFDQEAQSLEGTFMTETGDYRYLDGQVDGNTLRLSTFDGSHAFLFTGDIVGDSIHGMFYSGTHWQEPWHGVVDDEATLRDPDALTYLKPGYESINFAFSNEARDMVSLEDPRYQGQVVIVQLLGSWCPNCMDETRLFAQWDKTYRDQGLEIIGLAFERASEPERAWKNLSRMRRALDVEYEILLANNSSSKIEAAAALPMLNHVMSFPTSIYIDRAGRVRKIHTGFYGPGTGAPYLRFVEQYKEFVEELLSESVE